MKQIRTRLSAHEFWKEVPCVLEEPAQAKIISIDTKERKQTMIGFGGAFTEASAYNLRRVSARVRSQVIKDYFDPVDGLGYSMGRVSIHGCDFSLGSYLYIRDHDDTLASFDISRDQPIIDLIRDAEQRLGKKIKVLASPWTPPFWMKDNNSPIRGGHLLPRYYSTYADYLVKFIQSYREKGINIDMITVQNEPAAVQRWDSCIYSPEEERDFVKVLGNALEKAGLADVRLLVWDHNRDIMIDRVKPIYADPVSRKYVWGTAFHWYDNEQFQEVARHHDLFPDKHLLFTEGCQENGPHFGETAVGERYARNMIHDLRNYTEGYLDWNLVLDETGGPNHVNNLCSAPIILKIWQEEIIKMPSYYYIGHFSRYIQPGAIQIGSSGTDKLLYVAFQNPNGEMVLVVQNENNDSVNVKIHHVKEEVCLTIHGHSISTLIL